MKNLLRIFHLQNFSLFFPIQLLSILAIVSIIHADTIPGPPEDGESVLILFTSTTEYSIALKDAYKDALESIASPAVVTVVEIKSGDGSDPGFYDELVAQTGKKELDDWCQVYDLRFRDDKHMTQWTGQDQEDVLTYIGTNTDWELFENYLNIGGSLFLQGEHAEYYIRNANLLMFVNHVAQQPITQITANVINACPLNTFSVDPENFSTDFNDLTGGSISGNWVGGISLNNVGSGRPLNTGDPIGAMALAYLSEDLKTSTGRLVVSFESNAFVEPGLQNATSKGYIQNVYDLLSGCYRYDMTKTFIPDTILVDSTGIFTLAYENNGEHDLDNVTISDTIPTCLEFLSSTPAPTGNTNNYYWWVIPTIAAGTSSTITVNYRCISLPAHSRKGGYHE